jgi:large subunit ribosomal protein L15
MTAEIIDLETLKKSGAVPRLAMRAKVILAGELKRKVALKGLLVSKGAKAAIEKAGGSIEQPVEKAGS